MFFSCKKDKQHPIYNKNGKHNELVMVCWDFFWGGRTWYRFWCAETYYVNISKKKGIFERKFKGIDLTELDRGIVRSFRGGFPCPLLG